MIVTKKPCRECPFRKESPRSWLGPWESPAEFMTQAFSEAGLACHMSVREDGNPEGTKVCCGSIHCANKSAKRYRNPELAELQDAVDPTQADDVLSAPEFMRHHTTEEMPPRS